MVEKITDKEYERILNVWEKLEMKTMKDYHDLHLKCDVLSLADVFEKVRNNGLKGNETNLPNDGYLLRLSEEN